MTWIIGASALFGYGALISDVQVSISNGSTMDCLQKIYNLNDFYIAGFAGSVNIGFQMIGSLKNHLDTTNSDDPQSTLNQWSSVAVKLYNQQDFLEQKLSSELLVVANSPNQDLENTFQNKIYIFKMKAPHFVPELITDRMRICHIGSGSQVPVYKKSIHKKINMGINDPSLQAEVLNPGGWGRSLCSSLTHLINEYPTAGISKHLQIMTIFQNSVIFSNNDMITHLDNQEKLILKMPALATNYNVFLNMLKLKGVNPSAAKC